MTRRRQRDRQLSAAPAPHDAPPTSGPGPSHPPDAGGAPKPTAGRVAELVSVATRPGATAADVTAARAELARVLATALDLALDQADLDQVLKLTDRLTKLLPSAPAGVPAEPEPAAGGDPDGADDTGAVSSAQRFRLLSGELGNPAD